MTDSPTSRPRPPFILTSAFDTDFDAETALQELVHAPGDHDGAITLLRVILLRRDYPDAQVETNVVESTAGGRALVVRAAITLPTGAAATGLAVAGEGGLSLEEAERRALGRALDVIGHTVLIPDGTAHTRGDAVPTRTAAPQQPTREHDSADRPARQAPPAPRPATTSPAQSPAPSPAAPQVAAPAVIDAMRRANRRRHPADTELPEGDAPQGATGAAAERPAQHAPTPEPEPALEDYSWTAFWRVARPQGLNKVKVEEIIGRSIDGMTPLQVRDALTEAGVVIS
ncbi:MAG TPA: hypothetical protein VNZ55_10805 [Thermomicrobiales bacterium]|nr:hypothetical protein [Thermomicrobiales bacterium]